VLNRNGNRTIVFIIAGGRSSRMGRDKSRLLLGGKTFLQRITSAARQLNLPVELIDRDDQPGLGPLGGILTAFQRFRFERALFLSCDMPLVSPEFLERVLELSAGGAVFVNDLGRAGFPFVLPRSAHTALRRSVENARISLQEFSREIGAAWLSPRESERAELFNVNTPEDYQRLLEYWRAQRTSGAVLDVRNLSIERSGTRILEKFSWTIRAREHWVVLGANGCGKTSLLSALLGYVTPTRGDIFLLGEEYGDSDWPELRKKIGVVSSSVRQMMAEAEPAWITVASGKYAMIDFWGTPGKRDKGEAFALLRQIECEHIAERPWAVLSQGERQRVLIARALIAKPALLILDEPCAGLDPAAREHFLAFLERLGRKRGSPAIVLVTHHVEEVMPVFTHALLLKKGRKVAEGPISRILTAAHLSEAFDTPIRVRKSAARYSLKITALGRAIA
jgi:iron complex transport system ATP-binding protein